jgi:hypothetical protein
MLKEQAVAREMVTGRAAREANIIYLQNEAIEIEASDRAWKVYASPVSSEYFHFSLCQSFPFRRRPSTQRALSSTMVKRKQQVSCTASRCGKRSYLLRCVVQDTGRR